MCFRRKLSMPPWSEYSTGSFHYFCKTLSSSNTSHCFQLSYVHICVTWQSWHNEEVGYQQYRLYIFSEVRVRPFRNWSHWKNHCAFLSWSEELKLIWHSKNRRGEWHCIYFELNVTKIVWLMFVSVKTQSRLLEYLPSMTVSTFRMTFYVVDSAFATSACITRTLELKAIIKHVIIIIIAWIDVTS